MKKNFAVREISLAVLGVVGMTAIATGSSAVLAAEKTANKPAGKYVTGDFHNHTTCSDGTLSLKKLVDKSAGTFGLDWFVQAGHGGTSARNCTLAEDPFEPVAPALGLTAPPTIPAGGQLVTDAKGPNQLWTNTIGNAAIKGDVSGTATSRNMWRWQMIQEYVYPVIEKESRDRNKPIFVGLEQVVPGHEHTSTGIIDGQLPATGAGNATAMAKFEYCFDRADTDTSRGATNQWDCSVTGSANNGLINDTAKKIIVASGTGSGTAGHIKTVEGVKWMAANYPKTSYYVPAHLERAGVFNPNGNNGFNIEHLRNFNNAGPTVAFGFETMPGHQADPARGSYSTGAVGGGTFGGVGVYGAKIGGVWDALLGEGRNWFFFGSSDYHNRGSFGPDQRESNADFFPGEYTKDYVMARTGTNKLGTQAIVDGLRSGNSFVVNGGLIDQLSFVVCAANPAVVRKAGAAAVEAAAVAAAAKNTDVAINGCATMGEKLIVRSGADLIVSIVVRDPIGTNNSPYTFPNPSLKQIGISQPLNAPVLDHIDVISGNVTGYVDPSNTAAYAGLIGSPAASNPSAALAKTFNSTNWTALPDGTRKMTYRVPAVKASQYLRLRGTNLPPATPFETDASGNPLLDFGSDGKIPCGDAACPAHMTVTTGVKTASFDVAAWSDLWFYSNPVFIEVLGSTKIAGIK
ncbi:hypothetical protein BH11PSE11_BH11PSE11_24030 [soil metagenome]